MKTHYAQAARQCKVVQVSYPLLAAVLTKAVKAVTKAEFVKSVSAKHGSNTAQSPEAAQELHSSPLQHADRPC